MKLYEKALRDLSEDDHRRSQQFVFYPIGYFQNLFYTLLSKKAEDRDPEKAQEDCKPSDHASSTDTEFSTDPSIETSLGPYLLLCVDEGDSPTRLYQERLGNISNDRDLFEFIRAVYFTRNRLRRWFTAKSVKRLSLTKVCKLTTPLDTILGSRADLRLQVSLRPQ